MNNITNMIKHVWSFGTCSSVTPSTVCQDVNHILNTAISRIFGTNTDSSPAKPLSYQPPIDDRIIQISNELLEACSRILDQTFYPSDNRILKALSEEPGAAILRKTLLNSAWYESEEKCKVMIDLAEHRGKHIHK